MLVEAQTLRERLLLARWTILPSPARIRDAYELPGDRSSVMGYLRWWDDLAKSVVPAAKFVTRRRFRRRPPEV
jgi:hypothetical protein